MTTPNWLQNGRLGAQLRSVLRMVGAFLFIQSGTMNSSVPMAMPDGTTAKLLTEIGIAGVLEVVEGACSCSSVHPAVAFLLSGEMAVAYFQFHARSFWAS